VEVVCPGTVAECHAASPVVVLAHGLREVATGTFGGAAEVAGTNVDVGPRVPAVIVATAVGTCQG
jgi:hypothetical protein